MSLKWPDVKAESDAFAAEAKEIEAWWETNRQKHIKRFVSFLLKPQDISQFLPKPPIY